MAEQDQINYVEVSAKSGDGVEAMFEVLSKELYKKFEEYKASREDSVIRVTSTARNIPEDWLCCNIC